MSTELCRVDSKRKAAQSKKGRRITIRGERERREKREERREVARRMLSKEQKRAALHEKLQHLRSITNSHALNKTSIIIDASKYIEKLKQKVERLNEEIASAETSSVHNPLPMVTVETLEKGFLINVFSAKGCSGLLVSILEAFEEMRLTVLEARVSCTDTFRFEAVGENEEQGETIDAHAVKQAVGQAIMNWSKSGDQEE
ncbi:hypothetical protein VNO78_31673 [Psophocarpus tetragonolobus]|uniref:Plant bHLH transcription factor ACT-like domain-containing protein n=1 Tax=Psophocarpus tetragonolobus TaxID=3891 RepID=A0AAN9RYR9_PSOTE